MTTTITFDETKFKLVPLEPTEEMTDAALSAFQANASAKGVYRAMLNAAPAAEEAPGQEAVIKYVPVNSKLRDANWNHPNDNEPRTDACREALLERGDNEGQGLDGYWKWGFAAGFNAALKQQPATHGEPVISTKHGPWIESKHPGEEGESYCQRCLLRDKFLGSRECDPHIEMQQPTPELVQAARQMIQAWSDCSGYPDTLNEIEQIDTAIAAIQNALKGTA